MAGLVSIFTGTYELHAKLAEVVIAPLDKDGKVDGELKARTLQYWPENLTDDKGSNWQSRDIPGAPLPLYQWISGSERGFNFTAVFSRDMDGIIGDEIEPDKYNVDIDAGIAWLRAISMNDYENGFAVAPPVVWIWFEGTELGYNYNAESEGSKSFGGKGSGVHCLITQVSAERTNWFQSGTTRFATVPISCVETMQVGKTVIPYGRKHFKKLWDRWHRNAKMA